MILMNCFSRFIRIRRFPQVPIVISLIINKDTAKIEIIFNLYFFN